MELLGDLLAERVEGLYFVEAYLGVGNQFLFLFYFGALVLICSVLRVEWDKECGYMEVLNWEVEKCLCQGFYFFLPSFCVLPGWMKAHFYESFAEISLGPFIFVDVVATFLLPDIIFGQCVVVHNSVASIRIFEAIFTIVERWVTSFVRSI